jgi:hypothetical protein
MPLLHVGVMSKDPWLDWEWLQFHLVIYILLYYYVLTMLVRLEFRWCSNVHSLFRIDAKLSTY